MAGANETPRQKMMGILYLVLLGLAATTITQQVLDAFRNLTVGLENSTGNVTSTIDQTFSAYAASKLKDDPTRAKPFWDRANRIKAAADDLNKYIVETKAIFEKECGGFDETGEYKNREDVDISPRIMINKKRGAELKAKIEETKNKILAELDPQERANFKMALNADAPPKKEGIKKSWEENFFGDGIPLTAAITALTKIQADIRNTELNAVKIILGNVDKAEINLDQYAAIAVPTSSSYVLVGQPYSAEVFLTAFSSSLNPDIVVGGQKLSVNGGKGIYTVNTSREGEFKWSAVLKMKKADGSIGEWKTPEMSYRVARPSAVVSPDMMNVFYIGVDNPVSVSAPGMPKEKLKISVSNGGTATGSNGAYNIRVTQPGNVTVSIFGEENGKQVKLGENPFRCKRIPRPRAKFAGKSSGAFPKAQFTAVDRILANIEDFEFKAQFNIVHFKLIIQKPHQDPIFAEGNSNIFTADMKAKLGGVTPGTKVYFDDILSVGPDGVKTPLDPIIFTVQ